MPDELREFPAGRLRSVTDGKIAGGEYLEGMNSHPFPSRSTSSSTNPSQDEIALRAHQLWCQQGCPQGHDLDNWLEAESQLRSESTARDASIPLSEAVETTQIGGSTSPYSEFSEEAPLATKVDKSIVQRGRASGRSSPTSLEL